MTLSFSKHAMVRMQQRGMRVRDITLASSLFDAEMPVGRGLSALRLSRGALLEARANGIPAKAIARISRAVLLAADDGTLVTCLRPHGPRASNYSRRDRRNYWKK